MITNDLKIGKDWSDYKLESKKFIYDYNKDELYKDTKVKVGSLWTLLLQKRTSIGLTDDFRFIDKFDVDEFYQFDNSFKC